MVNDLYSANDERYLKQELLEYVDENIKKIEIYNNDDVLVLVQSKDDYEIYVANDEKGIESLENAISKINKEKTKMKGEEM